MIQTSNLTVEFNSVHVNILSLLSDSLLFPIIMADNNVVGGGDENSVRFIHHLIRNSQRRRLMMQLTVHYLFARRRRLLSVCLISFLMLLSQRRVITQLPRRRSCRRLLRNTGWWENVWNNYSEAQFKKTLILEYLGRLFGTFWTVLSLYWQDKRWQRALSHLTKDLPYAYIDWEEGTIFIQLQKWWEEVFQL